MARSSPPIRRRCRPDQLDFETLWRHPDLLLLPDLLGADRNWGSPNMCTSSASQATRVLKAGRASLYSSAILMRRASPLEEGEMARRARGSGKAIRNAKPTLRPAATTPPRRLRADPPLKGEGDVGVADDGTPILLPLDLIRGKRFAYNRPEFDVRDHRPDA